MPEPERTQSPAFLVLYAALFLCVPGPLLVLVLICH